MDNTEIERIEIDVAVDNAIKELEKFKRAFQKSVGSDSINNAAKKTSESVKSTVKDMSKSVESTTNSMAKEVASMIASGMKSVAKSIASSLKSCVKMAARLGLQFGKTFVRVITNTITKGIKSAMKVFKTLTVTLMKSIASVIKGTSNLIGKAFKGVKSLIDEAIDEEIEININANVNSSSKGGKQGGSSSGGKAALAGSLLNAGIVASSMKTISNAIAKSAVGGVGGNLLANVASKMIDAGQKALMFGKFVYQAYRLFKQYWPQILDAFGKISEKVAPILKQGFAAVTESVGNLLSKGMSIIVTEISKIPGLLLPILKTGFMRMINIAGKTFQAGIKRMMESPNPYIRALGVTLDALQKAFRALIPVVSSVTNFIANIIGDLELDPLFGGFTTLAAGIDEVATALRPLLTTAINGVIKAFGYASEAVNAMMRALAVIVEIVSPLGQVISPLISLFSALCDTISIFANGIRDLFERLYEPLKRVIDLIGRELSNAINFFTSIINGVNERLKSFIESFNVTLAPALSEFIQSIENLILKISKLIKSIFGVIGKVLNAVGINGETLGKAFDALGKVVTWLADVITKAFTGIVDLVSFITDCIGDFVEFLGDVLVTLINFVKVIPNAIKSFVGKVKDFVSQLKEKIPLIGKVIDGFKTTVEIVMKPFRIAIETVTGWLSKLLDGIKKFFFWLRKERKESLTESEANDIANSTRYKVAGTYSSKGGANGVSGATASSITTEDVLDSESIEEFYALFKERFQFDLGEIIDDKRFRTSFATFLTQQTEEAEKNYDEAFNKILNDLKSKGTIASLEKEYVDGIEQAILKLIDLSGGITEDACSSMTDAYIFVDKMLRDLLKASHEAKKIEEALKAQKADEVENSFTGMADSASKVNDEAQKANEAFSEINDNVENTDAEIAEMVKRLDELKAKREKYTPAQSNPSNIQNAPQVPGYTFEGVDVGTGTKEIDDLIEQLEKEIEEKSKKEKVTIKFGDVDVDPSNVEQLTESLTKEVEKSDIPNAIFDKEAIEKASQQAKSALESVPRSFDISSAQEIRSEFSRLNELSENLAYTTKSELEPSLDQTAKTSTKLKDKLTQLGHTIKTTTDDDIVDSFSASLDKALSRIEKTTSSTPDTGVQDIFDESEIGQTTESVSSLADKLSQLNFKINIVDDNTDKLTQSTNQLTNSTEQLSQTQNKVAQTSLADVLSKVKTEAKSALQALDKFVDIQDDMEKLAHPLKSMAKGAATKLLKTELKVTGEQIKSTTKDIVSFKQRVDDLNKQDLKGFAKLKENFKLLGDAAKLNREKLRLTFKANTVAKFIEKMNKPTEKATKELVDKVPGGKDNIGLFKGALGKIGLLVGGIGIGSLIKTSTEEAIKFESAIMQLNGRLGESVSILNDFASGRGLEIGLSRGNIAEFGNIFSVYVKNFAKDTEEMATTTRDLLEAAAITAQSTGYSMQEVLEGFRSGLTGSSSELHIEIYENSLNCWDTLMGNQQLIA